MLIFLICLSLGFVLMTALIAVCFQSICRLTDELLNAFKPNPVNLSHDLPDPWAPITPDKRYELYVQTTEQLQDFANKTSDSFEKAMITLSGGALGLSITFLSQLKDRDINYPLLMPISWLCFATSLGVMIWSFQVSRASYDKQMFVLDRKYFDYADEVNELEQRPAKIAAKAVWLFYAGIACLCVFGFVNAGSIMSNKNNNVKIQLNEGNPPRLSPALGKPKPVVTQNTSPAGTTSTTNTATPSTPKKSP
jgi:hypothetical protein